MSHLSPPDKPLWARRGGLSFLNSLLFSTAGLQEGAQAWSSDYNSFSLPHSPEQPG